MHPLVSGFENTGVPEDEGQLLQSVYPPAWAFGGPGKFGFHPAAHLTETSPLVGAASRERLLSEWKPYWNLEKPVLVEKSPPNLIRTRFLQSLFPECSFIVLMRHPIAVAYATQKWSHTSIRPLVEHWLVCHEIFERDRSELGRLLVLKYEDFVAEPGVFLQRIHAFLGLDDATKAPMVRTDVNEKYLNLWRRYKTSSAGAAGASAIIDAFEERTRRFGYSLD